MIGQLVQTNRSEKRLFGLDQQNGPGKTVVVEAAPEMNTRFDRHDLEGTDVHPEALEGEGVGDLNIAVYSATKAAIRSFARSWTADLKARQIRVNVLSPGPIQTPGFDVFANADVKSFMQSIVPLGRIGTADEVAKAALFLASDDSSFVAGVELFVDGGSVAV